MIILLFEWGGWWKWGNLEQLSVILLSELQTQQHAEQELLASMGGAGVCWCPIGFWWGSNRVGSSDLGSVVRETQQPFCKPPLESQSKDGDQGEEDGKNQ